jgi:hypothetical protein
MPEGYELQIDRGLAASLKIKNKLFQTDVNEYVWVVCDLVRETFVGEKALRLLTPTPIKVAPNSVGFTNREYVPIEAGKFSIIELKMYTNLSTMKLFDGVHNILVVLHFRAKHKRKGYGDGRDHWTGDCKKFCEDGRSGRFLQQTTEGREQISFGNFQAY